MNSQKLLKLIEQRHEQECELMQLADQMASAAAHMNPQNYDTLLQARQQFKEKLHDALSGQAVKELPFAY